MYIYLYLYIFFIFIYLFVFKQPHSKMGVALQVRLYTSGIRNCLIVTNKARYSAVVIHQSNECFSISCSVNYINRQLQQLRQVCIMPQYNTCIAAPANTGVGFINVGMILLFNFLNFSPKLPGLVLEPYHEQFSTHHCQFWFLNHITNCSVHIIVSSKVTYFPPS